MLHRYPYHSSLLTIWTHTHTRTQGRPVTVPSGRHPQLTFCILIIGKHYQFPTCTELVPAQVQTSRPLDLSTSWVGEFLPSLHLQKLPSLKDRGPHFQIEDEKLLSVQLLTTEYNEGNRHTPPGIVDPSY